MTLLPLLDEHSRPESKSLVQAIRQQRQGRLPRLYALLLNSPALAEGWLAFFTALRQRTRLSDRHRELVILRVTHTLAAQHEFDSHVPFAGSAGLSSAQIQALARGELPSAITPAELTCLGYTDVVLRDARQADTMLIELRRYFDDEQCLEITVTIAAYRMVATVSQSLQLDRTEDRA